MLFCGEVIFANVISEQGKHGDHEGALDRDSVDNLSSRLEDAPDLLQSTVKLLRLQVFQNTDQEDRIELVVRIGHIQHIAVP